MTDQWTPTPIPLLPAGDDGKVPYDIGDDMRAAIAKRLQECFEMDRDLTSEKARQLAMFGAAAVRALFYETGVLGHLAQETPKETNR